MHNYFRNSFFPSSIVEWNKLSREVRNSENIRIFKKRILEFIRPSPNSIFDIYNPYGIKLLTRLRLGLSHFNEHTFKHGFSDTINPICICGGDIESINHFFRHCPEYCEAKQTLFGNIQNIDKMLLSQNESSLTHLHLCGDPKPNCTVNALILNSAIEVILSSWRFNGLLFNGARSLKHFFLFLIHFLNGFLFVFVYLFRYLSFVLISQVLVNVNIWFCWLLVLLQSVYYFLSFLVSSVC